MIFEKCFVRVLYQNKKEMNIGKRTKSVWEKNGFMEYPHVSPKEFQNVEWSLNGHSTSFKGKMYFQSGTGFLFIEKENGEIYKPKNSNKLFWREISKSL